jgi:alpha-beta hydrolase superfamily lysophospholipase
MTRLRRVALAVSLILSQAACAPTIKVPGPPIVEPRLDAGAVVAADGARLPLRAWLPGGHAKAVVVAAHGFNDYSNAFDGLGGYLAGQGIAVYAFDQRGFGAAPNVGYWAGESAMADDLATTVLLIRRRYRDVPVYLLGESMGGALVMVTMARPGAPPVDGVVLSAPAVWGRDSMTLLERGALWVTSHTMPWLTLTGEGLNILPSDNLDMLRALGRDPLVIKKTRVDAIHGLCDLMDAAQAAAPELRVPALVLYGEHDEVVPAAPTYRMMRRLPNTAAPQVMAVYANGYHMLLRDLQAPVVWGDIAAWIVAPGQPLPSGADRRAREVLRQDVEPE